MSGPKLSQAEIERMRQERLERERLQAIKRLQDAQGAYRDVCAKVSKFRSGMGDIIKQIDPLYRSDVEAKANMLLSRVRIVQVNGSKLPEDYYAANKEMTAMLEDIQKEVDSLLGIVVQRSKTDKRMKNLNASYQAFQTVVDSTGREVDAVKIDFTNDYDVKLVKQQLQAMIDHFDKLICCNDGEDVVAFSKQAISKLRKEESNVGNAGNLNATRKTMQAIVDEEQEIIRLWKEKKTLYDTYYALAVMTDRAPKAPEDFASIEPLKTEINALQQLFRQQDEMDYIADQINDAMVDLGYSFVSSSVLTKKNQGETEYSLYKADEQTGIAVYTDESGAVMMRVTVLGDDPIITDDDRDFCYQRQIDFCAAHPDLVDALAKRGVFFKQLSYKEPSRDDTFKVDMKSQTGAVVSQNTTVTDGKQKIDRRRRRRAGNKKVRAM